MERRTLKNAACIAAAAVGFMLVSRFLPGFALWWREVFLRPAAALLSRLTAPVSFPAAEPLALLLVLRPRRLIRRLAVLLLLYALLWYPAYWCGDGFPQTATKTQLETLCGILIDRLNRSPLDFPDASETLSGLSVKAVRYPEWMHSLNISGMYIPFTGEALADTSVSAAELPFTARHELMHREGIADEGAANIAAYRLCRSEGGYAADSADLRALKYALGLLRTKSESAWRSCIGRMNDRLFQTVSDMNGFSYDASAEAPPVLSLIIPPSDYAALAHWLAIDIDRAS